MIEQVLVESRARLDRLQYDGIAKRSSSRNPISSEIARGEATPAFWSHWSRWNSRNASFPRATRATKEEARG
jgi:hypothetical protein